MKKDTSDIVWGVLTLGQLLLLLLAIGYHLELKRQALERVTGRPVSTLDAWLLTRER